MFMNSFKMPIDEIVLIVQSAPSEAQRLVFMSWPGQKELDDGCDVCEKCEPSESSSDSSALILSPTALVNHSSVMPPKAQKEEMQHKTTIRQLG